MPRPVLELIQHDLLDYGGSGLSVLEMSHRSSEFAQIAGAAEQNLRKLLKIPENYSVLFMQGGASSQFALCVQNLDNSGEVSYANTGYWSKKAIATGQALTNAREVVQCLIEPEIKIPNSAQWKSAEGSSFLHITDNETIDGVVYDAIPESSVPLVADFSSSILSAPIDISRYGLIYAGAQNDLLDRSQSTSLPPVFNYAAMAKAGSMLNTPPTFAWYAAGLVFEWLLEQGGLEAMAVRNASQADKVYQQIDDHSVYENRVCLANRSQMNVPFTLPTESLTSQFLAGAAERNLIGLKGHKSIGGVRASLYNAITDEAVEVLVNYMDSFARENS